MTVTVRAPGKAGRQAAKGEAIYAWLRVRCNHSVVSECTVVHSAATDRYLTGPTDGRRPLTVPL